VAHTAGLCAATLGLTARAQAQPRPARTGAKGEKMMDGVIPKARMPVVFLPHGGGPWPFTHDPVVGNPRMYAEMSKYMTRLNMVPPQRPKAVLVISAHWEAPVPTVMTAANPPMLYDYSGFPPETYQVKWPAPGAPEVAGTIQSLLQNAGFPHATDKRRGFDHGVFVPLKLAYPGAEVPTLQLSLQRGLDPRTHLAMGRALAPLRDQGVFIVGSGMSYHNMRNLMGNFRRDPASTPILEDSLDFDHWLAETMSLEPDRRETRLTEWQKAPSARSAHPREEHLLPLHVIAGAAGNAVASLPYRGVILGAQVSAVHFG
jgi:aromatic ring-opening dioxygenase catalytic subunit (LigB family)